MEEFDLKQGEALEGVDIDAVQKMMIQAAGRKESIQIEGEADLDGMFDDDSDDSSDSSSEEEVVKNDMVLNGEDAGPPMSFGQEKIMDLKPKRKHDSDDDEPLMTAEDMLKVQVRLI